MDRAVVAEVEVMAVVMVHDRVAVAGKVNIRHVDFKQA